MHYVCVVKRVSTYLHRTKQVENQAGLLVGQIQNFQSDPHNSLAQAYPGEEFIATGSHMTSCNQGSFSKQPRKNWEWGWHDFFT